MLNARVVVLALALASCNKSETKPSQGSAGSGSASATQPAQPAGAVQIYVDDQVVGTIAAKQVALWPRLDTLVPVAARRLGTWQALKLTGKGKPVEITQPSATHPQLVPALFPGEDGAPAFGMFDPVELANKGKPALRENAITEVRVVLAKGTGRGENEHHGEGGGDPTQLKLTVKANKAEQVIEGPVLLALERESAPGETGDGKGWKLSTLMEKAGVKKYTRLVLTDAKGVNLNLEKQDLDPATSVPFVKLNRQGQLRFRVFKKQGDTWQPSMDLRGLTTIEVLE